MSETKFNFCKYGTEWIGHKIDQIGIRSLQDKVTAKKEWKKPKKGTKGTQKKGTKLGLGHPSLIQTYLQSCRPNGQFETITKKRQSSVVDGKTYTIIRKSQTKNHGNTVSGTL